MNNIEQIVKVVEQEGIASLDLSDKQVFDTLELLSKVAHEYERVVWVGHKSNKENVE